MSAPVILYKITFITGSIAATTWSYEVTALTERLAIVDACRRHALHGRSFSEISNVVSLILQKELRLV